MARLALRVLTPGDARAQVPEHFRLVGDVEIPFEVIGPGRVRRRRDSHG